jgi:starch synthase
MADTIEDPGADTPLTAMAFANGLLFDGDHVDAMANALSRAMHLRKHPMLWRAMQRNAMSTDFSWQRAVGAYEELLASLVSREDAAQEQGEALSQRHGQARAQAQGKEIDAATPAAEPARNRRTRQARGSMMPV